MKGAIPPRLRAPALLMVAAAVALAIGGATHGWHTVLDVIPIPIVAIVGIYLLTARDSDAGALARRDLDERQAYQRTKVQALVGRAVSFAVAVGYLVASASKTELWPWAALLGVVALSLGAGWWLYGERGGR